jgi:hypothetical protein
MAMNASTLGKAISQKVEQEASKDGATSETIWTAVATEIINHITANAQVSVNVNTTVTTPTGAGTGVGTGTGTIV